MFSPRSNKTAATKASSAKGVSTATAKECYENLLKYHESFVRQYEIHELLFQIREKFEDELKIHHRVPSNDYRTKMLKYEEQWAIFLVEHKFLYDKMEFIEMFSPDSKGNVPVAGKPAPSGHRIFGLDGETVLEMDALRTVLYRMMGKIADDRNYLFRQVAPQDIPSIPELPHKLGENDSDIHFVRQLMLFTHPRLDMIKIVPHGMLGEEMYFSKFSSIGNDIIVDFNDWATLKGEKAFKESNATSQALYQWLGIKELPERVTYHWKQFLQESHCQYSTILYQYAENKWVIHALAPQITSVSKAMNDLANVYSAVIECVLNLIHYKKMDASRKIRLTPSVEPEFITMKELIPHIPLVTVAAFSMCLTRLPFEAIEDLKDGYLQLCVPNPIESALYNRRFKYAREAQKPVVVDFQGNQLIKKNEKHFWIRNDNKSHDRLERLTGAFQSLTSVWARGYVYQGQLKKLSGVDKMLKETEFLLQEDAAELIKEFKNPGYETMFVNVADNKAKGTTAMDVAARRTKQGMKVVSINAASAYHCGGGVLTGGRHALEESWCMTSTLLSSLLKGEHIMHLEHLDAKEAKAEAIAEKAQYLEEQAAKKREEEEKITAEWRKQMGEQTPGGRSPGSPGSMSDNKDIKSVIPEPEGPPEDDKFLSYPKPRFEAHIPIKGCLLSPDVEIFRSEAAQGYAYFEEPVRISGIVSIASFNKNPMMSDSPLDYPRSREEYMKQLGQKWQAAIIGAIKLGAEVIVVPDVGCGVFRNDPVITAEVFNIILRETYGYFKEVIVLGKDAFMDTSIIPFMKSRRLSLLEQPRPDRKKHIMDIFQKHKEKVEARNEAKVANK